MPELTSSLQSREPKFQLGILLILPISLALTGWERRSTDLPVDKREGRLQQEPPCWLLSVHFKKHLHRSQCCSCFSIDLEEALHICLSAYPLLFRNDHCHSRKQSCETFPLKIKGRIKPRCKKKSASTQNASSPRRQSEHRGKEYHVHRADEQWLLHHVKEINLLQEDNPSLQAPQSPGSLQEQFGFGFLPTAAAKQWMERHAWGIQG